MNHNDDNKNEDKDDSNSIDSDDDDIDITWMDGVKSNGILYVLTLPWIIGNLVIAGGGGGDDLCLDVEVYMSGRGGGGYMSLRTMLKVEAYIALGFILVPLFVTIFCCKTIKAKKEVFMVLPFLIGFSVLGTILIMTIITLIKYPVGSCTESSSSITIYMYSKLAVILSLPLLFCWFLCLFAGIIHSSQKQQNESRGGGGVMMERSRTTPGDEDHVGAGASSTGKQNNSNDGSTAVDLEMVEDSEALEIDC